MTHKTDKKKRLISAAKDLIYRQGFNLTTLADIAAESQVPLGNVYYYFKTKEAIIESVLEELMEELKVNLSKFSQEISPLMRLMAYLDHMVGQVDSLAKSGCAIGSLCQELAKQGGNLSNSAHKLLAYLLNWSERQFLTIGFSDEIAKQLAFHYIAAIQGMSILTNSAHSVEDAAIIAESIKSWLKNLENNLSHKTAELIADEILF